MDGWSNTFLLPQVFAEVSPAWLRMGNWHERPLLYVHPVLYLLPLPGPIYFFLWVLWRGICGTHPSGDIRHSGTFLSDLGSGRGLLPTWNPIPGQPTDWRYPDSD